MPELPEVETTARFLHERVVGCTITDVWVGWSKSFVVKVPHGGEQSLVGTSFVKVGRRAKYVVAELNERAGIRQYLLGHMRMSGSFDVVRSLEPRATHDRVILTLSNGQDLRFNDPRKFGRMYLCSDPLEITATLGIEPLSADFTPELLEGLLKQRKGAIKPLLLNQSVIAGVGNIYADEALWQAGIHPLRSAALLPEKSIARLWEAIRAILTEAIETHGTDAGDGVVEGGMYQPRVYARNGEPCHTCKAPVQKIVVGQRGTHFCPRCQKL